MTNVFNVEPISYSICIKVFVITPHKIAFSFILGYLCLLFDHLSKRTPLRKRNKQFITILNDVNGFTTKSKRAEMQFVNTNWESLSWSQSQLNFWTVFKTVQQTSNSKCKTNNKTQLGRPIIQKLLRFFWAYKRAIHCIHTLGLSQRAIYKSKWTTNVISRCFTVLIVFLPFLITVIHSNSWFISDNWFSSYK